MALLENIIVRDTNANRPSAGTNGRLYFESDTGDAYRDNGSSWDILAAALLTGEIHVGADQMHPSTTNGCAALAKVEYITNDVDLEVLAFDPSTDEFAQFTVFLPPSYDGGTLTAKFVWTTASTAGAVIWGIQGRAYADGDDIDQAWGTAQTVTDSVTGADDIDITDATAAITLAGSPGSSQLAQFRVYRDADDVGDTHAADARLIAVELTYIKG